MIRCSPAGIANVLIVQPDRLTDGRGFFSETYSQKAFAEAGFTRPFVQDNHSRSATRFTIRGLHFQSPPAAQDKLVRVTRGAVLDIAVDIRRGSASYGRHVAIVLSDENWTQLLVPAGFAHGFCTLTDDCEVLYKVTAPYTPSAERGLAWDDPDLNIDWPERAKPILNDRDKAWPRFAELKTPFA